MDNYVGEIRMFAGNYAPAGWSLCDGSTLSIAEYEVLFTLLGTTFGGDGQTNFMVPDLRGRVPVHSGNGPGGLPNIIPGAKSGVESISLSQANMPPHNHQVNGVTATGTAASPAGLYPATASTASRNAYIAPATVPAPTLVQMNTNSIVPAGNGLPVSIMQPYMAVTYIIALYGIYPSHS
ncbi:Microcystin-dependent protein [Pedobacter westerhofensis]|uniref:Microcystin-dependent protein n=1 Tax=Pedobacter westerhofensis TaxID=425512 RepID=A0A521F728_9SPHI|nr:tail fiber protein [Pedobacter westerhofensis]SMO91937.1 Microcystin-dependent protein [Pedobacter westerhofensis]